MSAHDAQAMPEATPPEAVVRYYAYAALSFLAAAGLMLFHAGEFTGHFYKPHLLAITHLMALGWGTMIIMGASHQLVPVLTGKALYSLRLALVSFWLMAIGIPLLVSGFYFFLMGPIAKWGGRLVVIGVGCYVWNLWKTVQPGKTKEVHAIYMLTAAGWLFLTVVLGLALAYNHTFIMFKHSGIHYIPLHAHEGFVGWFLLLVIGVGSRLIPMFLISKYQNNKMLWWIYGLLNIALMMFLLDYLYEGFNRWSGLPALIILAAVLMFAGYIRKCYTQRIRRQVDHPMQLSVLSVVMLVLPFLALIPLIRVLLITNEIHLNLIMWYGFLVFFGWLTAIILGMTFKTLPFIIWNQVYGHTAGKMKTPDPKSLYNHRLFGLTGVVYLLGFFTFSAGIVWQTEPLLLTGAILFALTAGTYAANVFMVIFHKKNG